MPSNELEGLFFLLQRGRILRERFTLNILNYSEVNTIFGLPRCCFINKICSEIALNSPEIIVLQINLSIIHLVDSSS